MNSLFCLLLDYFWIVCTHFENINVFKSQKYYVLKTKCETMADTSNTKVLSQILAYLEAFYTCQIFLEARNIANIIIFG